jgi:hypothetical protein
MAKKKEESWITRHWRPMMAMQYFTVCLFDFVFGHIANYIFFAMTSQPFVAWIPQTIQGGGVYHFAMGAVLGVAAWTRGQEKITRINQFGDEEIMESSSTSQTPME